MKSNSPLWRRIGPLVLLWFAAPFPLYLWAVIALTLGLK